MSAGPFNYRAAAPLLAGIFVVSIFVHSLWEQLQTFAYDCGALSLNAFVVYHSLATLGDGGLMLVLYGAGWAIHRDPAWIDAMTWRDLPWIAGLGGVLATGIEVRALTTGRWAYSEWMPVIPGLGVGLIPILQLVLLPLPIFWTAARLVRRPRTV